MAVQRVIQEAVDAQKPLVSAGGLELQIDVANELPLISVDHDRILQVIDNLVGNSIKFTASGGRITLGAAHRNGEVLFWVKDTGSGIPAEHLPHVFDRFWQARRGAHHGAGLGLSIVHGIVEAHGGHVWVKSEGGQGTTFYFTVPVAAGAEASAVLH
jgi:signal transduction histidine kinase